MEHGDETNPSLQESELGNGEINDIAAVFDSLITATHIRDMTTGIVYDSEKSLSAVLQLPHHPDIIYQFYPAVTRSRGDLRLRIRLYPGSVVDGLADREHLLPTPNGPTQVNNVASKSVLLALSNDSLTTTLRMALVKTKAVLLDELPLEKVPDGEEGRTNYPLDEFEIVYVGEHSIWGEEALSEHEELLDTNTESM